MVRMTTICVLVASLIFIAGLFAAIVERTGERDEARLRLSRERREHKAAYAKVSDENVELDQENMRLHCELTEAQLLAGTVHIPHLRAVPTQRDDTEWPAIVRAVEGES